MRTLANPDVAETSLTRMMRAWLESAAAGSTPANNATRNQQDEGINLREIMFTPHGDAT